MGGDLEVAGQDGGSLGVAHVSRGEGSLDYHLTGGGGVFTIEPYSRQKTPPDLSTNTRWRRLRGRRSSLSREGRTHQGRRYGTNASSPEQAGVRRWKTKVKSQKQEVKHNDSAVRN